MLAQLPKIATRVAHDTRVLSLGRNVLRNGRGRWLAIAASLVVAAAISSLSAGDVQQAAMSCAPILPATKSVRPAAPPRPTTRPAIAGAETVRDVRIELALFGSGTHLADVTDRVAELLADAGMRGAQQAAGCAACGACSALPSAGG